MKNAHHSLLAFIDLALKAESPQKSSSSLDKDAACRAALVAYLDNNDIDLRKAVLSDFIYEFGEFLAHRYDKKYSPSTNREILRTLRKCLRIAIREGYVPNLDLVPSIIEKLDSQVWAPQSEADKKKQTMLRQDLNVKAAVAQLTRRLDVWVTKQSMGIVPKAADKKERTEALQTRCAAIYLFCLLTYGIEIEDALAIKRDWEGQDIPDSVYIEKYAMRLPLSPTAKKLVALYNQGSACTSHLFFTLDNKKYKDDLANAASLIEGHIIRFLAREGLPLYRRQSVGIDWLNYAIESGIPDCDAELLWRHRLDELPLSAAMPAIEKAQTAFSSSRGALDESWYLLSIIPLTVRRDKFLKILSSSGILGHEPEARKRIYAPEETLRDPQRGESAVFSRYLFFRATPMQAEFANTFSPYAYVLKDMSRTRFARIPESELRELQVMLRDFPDAVELVDGSRWLEEHNAQIVEGCKAVIRSGSLAGKEATVVRIKGRKSGRPTYFIEYVEGAIKFQTDLTGIQLDIVKR